jgi:hypothetical protein
MDMLNYIKHEVALEWVTPLLSLCHENSIFTIKIKVSQLNSNLLFPHFHQIRKRQQYRFKSNYKPI